MVIAAAADMAADLVEACYLAVEKKGTRTEAIKFCLFVLLLQSSPKCRAGANGDGFIQSLQLEACCSSVEIEVY